MSISINTKGPEETAMLGRKIGGRLKEGDVVALTGELGAGKTCLVKAILEGLDVHDRYSGTSPSFVLINEYKGRLPVYHFDIYRLNDIKEIIELDYREYFYGKGISIIEWADKIEELLPPDCIRIHINIKGEDERELNIQSPESRNFDAFG